MTTSTSPLRCSRSSPSRPPSAWRPLQRFASLVIVLAIAPATALADKKREAKAHVAKATKAHKNGHFEEAHVELEAAYALDPKPDLLYAIGQVYAKLGECGEATTYFKRFVATQKDRQVAKVVDQAIAACKPAPEPAAPPPPPPDNPPPPDSPPPDSPTPAADKPSPATDKPMPATDTPAPAAPPAQPFAQTKTTSAPMGAQQRSPWYKDKLGDGLVLGGVVATVVGIVEYRRALSDLDTAEDKASTTSLARYNELVDSAHSKRTASVVLVGAGGALITAGIIHYVLHDRATEVRTVGIAPSHGGGLVTYEGSF